MAMRGDGRRNSAWKIGFFSSKKFRSNIWVTRGGGYIRCEAASLLFIPNEHILKLEQYRED